jgi:hypothetical protein
LIELVHPTAGKVAKERKGFLGYLIELVHPTAAKVVNTVGLGMKKRKGKDVMDNLANFAV